MPNFCCASQARRGAASRVPRHGRRFSRRLPPAPIHCKVLTLTRRTHPQAQRRLCAVWKRPSSRWSSSQPSPCQPRRPSHSLALLRRHRPHHRRAPRRRRRRSRPRNRRPRPSRLHPLRRLLSAHRPSRPPPPTRPASWSPATRVPSLACATARPAPLPTSSGQDEGLTRLRSLWDLPPGRRCRTGLARLARQTLPCGTTSLGAATTRRSRRQRFSRFSTRLQTRRCRSTRGASRGRRAAPAAAECSALGTQARRPTLTS